MPPRKNVAVQPPAANLEIGSLYEQELLKINEDHRRSAALSMLQKLSPTNKTSLEQFINGVKQHKDVWAVVSAMGIVEFADAINDGRKLREFRAKLEHRTEGKRTRLNDNQKQSLKQLVLKVLEAEKEGLNRGDIAAHITNEQIVPLGVTRDELPNKLRQPLAELVHDKSIHTLGEKRLMKYLIGAGTVAPAPKSKKG